MTRQSNDGRDGFVIRLRKLHHARVQFHARTLAFRLSFDELTRLGIRLSNQVGSGTGRSIGPS